MIIYDAFPVLQEEALNKILNTEEGLTFARFIKNITAYAEARAAQAQRAATAYMETKSTGTNSTTYGTGSGEAAGAESCKETESSTAYAEANLAMTQLSAILHGSGEAAEAGNAGEATESGVQAEHTTVTQAEPAAHMVIVSGGAADETLHLAITSGIRPEQSTGEHSKTQESGIAGDKAATAEACEPYEDSHVQKTQDQSAATAYNNTASMEIISAENSASDGPRGPRQTANTDPTLQTSTHAAKGFPRKVTWNDPSVTHVGQQSVGASVINLYDVLGRSYRYHLRMKESRAKRAWRSTKRAFSYLFCCCIPERREECLTYIIT